MMCGGIINAHESMKTCDIYDINSNKWTEGANMSGGRSMQGMYNSNTCAHATLSDAIYAIGGLGDQADTSVEKYNLHTGTWVNVPSAVLRAPLPFGYTAVGLNKQCAAKTGYMIILRYDVLKSNCIINYNEF